MVFAFANRILSFNMGQKRYEIGIGELSCGAYSLIYLSLLYAFIYLFYIDLLETRQTTNPILIFIFKH